MAALTHKYPQRHKSNDNLPLIDLSGQIIINLRNEENEDKN